MNPKAFINDSFKTFDDLELHNFVFDKLHRQNGEDPNGIPDDLLFILAHSPEFKNLKEAVVSLITDADTICVRTEYSYAAIYKNEKEVRE